MPMRALKLFEPGQTPQVTDVPEPEPGACEVKVALKAAGLNHRELWIVKGMYPGMTAEPTLGADGAGVVVSVGAGVAEEMIGQECVIYPGLEWGDDPALPSPRFGLLGMPGPGTIAQYIVVAADAVLPKPAHLDFREAAALPLAGLTAWRALFTKAALCSGERVLVTGAGGGVAAQMAAFAIRQGAEVWVTSGSEETIAWAVEQGAAGGINYSHEKWGAQLAKRAGGFDVVVDGAPALGIGEYRKALNDGARVVLYGSTGGAVASLVVTDVFLKNLTVVGTNVGNRAEFGEMLDFVTAHGLTPVVEKSFPLEEAPAALAFLENEHSIGKVVIDID